MVFVSCKTFDNSNCFVIELKENPTTGYRWEYLTDDSVLSLVSDEYVINAKEGIVGAGGVRTFVFEVLQNKDAEINLYYRRSWEVFPATPDVIYKYNSKTNTLEKLI